LIHPDLVYGMEQEALFTENPVLSPDGRYIFFVERAAIFLEDGSLVETVNLKRLDQETEETILIQEYGTWPRVSPDGTKLAYVKYDSEVGSNQLYVVALDGSNPEILVELTAEDEYLDAPAWTADSEALIYSYTPAPTVGFFDQLIGTQLVYAHANHSLPADWWQVGLDGSDPVQLTDADDLLIYVDSEPDGDRIVYTSTSGVYLLHPDGTVEPILLGDQYRIVRWIK